MPERVTNSKGRWYVTIAQFAHGRPREDLVMDLQRGSVQEVLEQNGLGPGVVPTYALDWTKEPRLPRSGVEWNALAWQASAHAAPKACTKCAGGRGVFVTYTRGIVGEPATAGPD